MWRASGIILLVFFCCISGVSQELQPFSEGAETGKSEIEQPGELMSERGRKSEKALFSDEKALKAARQLNFKPGIAEALANLGRFYLEQGDSDNALKYLRSYRDLSSEIQDSVLLADSYYLLGRLYREQHFPVLAAEQFRQAIEIAHMSKDENLLSKFYNELGSLYYSQKKYALAELYLFKSIRHIPTDNEIWYAAALNNIGMVLKALKEDQKSLEYLKEALSIFQVHPGVGDLSAIMISIGEIYQDFNDYDLAEMYFIKALLAAQERKALERVVESYHHLAALQAEKEQYQLAYHYQSLHSAYKDSLARVTHQASQAEVTKKLELERRERMMNQLIGEKELELLSREYKISKVEISRKNQLIHIIGSLSLLLGMLAFILYQRNMLKKRKNEQLELQNLHAFAQNRKLQELNARLLKSEQQMKELNDTKDKFFKIISHDLRGPLNTLSGFILVMRKDMELFSKEELNYFSVRMERSLKGVTALLDNLFQWASAQTGLIKFSPVEFKFLKLVKENLFLLHGTAELKQIRLEYDIPQELSLTADIEMMRLLLRNLISNAVKFTNKGGKVKVSAYSEHGWIVIKIADNGIGITEENRIKLLHEKTVPSRRGTENEKGSGLGLLLCKEFVGMHNGKIEVESAPGEGTTFTIHLPVAVAEVKIEEVMQT